MTESMNNTNGTSNTTTPAPVAANLTEMEAAYARRLPEIVAVPAEEVILPKVDVHAAVITIRGALPEIVAMRGEIAALAGVDMALVDGLHDYTWAAELAHGRYLTATAPTEAVAKLYEEALELREALRVAAVALAHSGLLQASRLDGFKGLRGYKNVSGDVVEYAVMLLDGWPGFVGKTALTEAGVRHALQVASDLTEAVGKREQGSEEAQEAAEIRNRAVTLMVRAYDEVRRAVCFLRWRENDADEIAPSLYAGRGGRGKAQASESTDVPVPSDAAQSDAVAASPAPAPAASTVPAGLPGSSPFAVS